MSHSAAAVAALGALTALRSGQPATAAHVQALREFPGWGPLAPLFDTGLDQKRAGDAERLAQASRGMDLSVVAKSLDTSFYTPAHLVQTMWSLLQAAGFTGGRVLDLGCGTGRFLQHKPDAVAVDYTGVEIEPISAEIAQVLHPQADILVGDLAKIMPGRAFDAAIGNVPFASTKIRDGAVSMALHTYAALKAVTLTRPGGYVILVVSRHLLDASDSGGRDLIAERANLIGALRLPSRYFAAEGTDVVADLLILQVRPTLDGTVTYGSGWDQRFDRVDDAVQVSHYWALHPEFVAGSMASTGVHRSPLAVLADNPEAAVDAAAAAVIPVLAPMTAAPASEQFPDVRMADDRGRPEGSFHETSAHEVIRIVDGTVTPIARPTKELRALIQLREGVDELFSGDADWDRDDSDLAPMRARVAELYANYVRMFGPLNRGELVDGPVDPETGIPSVRWKTPAMGGFRSDPGFWRVLAIEVFDRNTGRAEPAEVLSRRVNRRPQPVVSAADPAEALAISVGEGGLDLVRIAALLGLPGEQEAITALGSLIFHDPALGHWVPARDYLSGQVRRKLAAAQLAAVSDDRYLANVAALEEVLPVWLTPADIRIELGSPLLTAADIEQFATEVLGARTATITYTRLAGHWDVELWQVSPHAQIAYGTSRRDPATLLRDGLNSRIPTVYDEEYDPATGNVRKVRSPHETEAAVGKLSELADRFAAWVWECPARARRIERDYNHQLNSFVPRTADGSGLQLPRLADGVTLWPWQKDWIDHALAAGDAYNAMEVGLGKTLCQLALAVTLRDFGLASKPLIAVPDHLIEFISVEAMRAFPACRFLIVTRKDLARDRRRLFAARCAAGEWDAVIMTHTGFSSIPMPVEYERARLAEELAEIGEHMREAGVRSKRLASMLRTTERRLARLRGHADPDMITFDMLGVDHISIDEADRFRRLPIHTVSDGFTLGSSTRAFDLYLKVQWLRERGAGRPTLALYSGTPWVNSLAESYVMQKLCAPRQLTDAGLESFDAWAATFVRFETLVEVAPDGSGFRSKRRPAVVQNLPELRTMLRGFMMLVRAEDVGIERPAAHFHTITAEPSPVATDYMADIVRRAEALRSGQSRDLRVDNMLAICSDGRSVALDTNLVGLAETPAARTKIVLCAEKVAQIYHAGKATEFSGSRVPGVFQFVMCDLGTPHPGNARTYGRLRAELVNRGVPSNKIRFAHEATSPKAREALYASCRSGETAVCVGSTALAGVGVNAQFRAAALHHLDQPWTAAAFEQRNGRIVRHGNSHRAVDIFAYVTSGTFDAFMAATIERKARGFAHLYAIDSTVREVDDIGETTLNLAEVKAAATGNELLLRQFQLRAQVRALRVARSTSMQNAVAARQQASADRTVAQTLSAQRDLLLQYRQAGEFSSVDAGAAAAALHALKTRSTVTIATLTCAASYRLRLGVDVISVLGSLRLIIRGVHGTLSSRDVPSQVRDGGPDRISTWAKRSVNAWLRGLDDRCAELAEEVADLTARAAAADEAAASVRFDRQAELDQLTAELDAVNSEVSAAATCQQAERPAA